jgi:hypothetical protein
MQVEGDARRVIDKEALAVEGRDAVERAERRYGRGTDGIEEGPRARPIWEPSKDPACRSEHSHAGGARWACNWGRPA